MTVSRPVWVTGAGLLAAAALILGALEVSDWWDASQLRQRRLAVTLSRLHGWVAAGGEVTRRADAVFGPPEDAETTVMALHRQASTAGVRMTEMRPQAQQVELLVEGSASAVGTYLAGLVAQRPPVRVDMVSIATQAKVDAPLTARVRVTPLPALSPEATSVGPRRMAGKAGSGVMPVER